MVARYGFGLGAVELKDGGTPIGLGGLIKRETWPDVDRGFALWERWERQGYAREMAAAVWADGRTTLMLPRVVALSTPDNERSGRLLEYLGFRFERMVRLDPTRPDCRLCAFPAPADVGPPRI